MVWELSNQGKISDGQPETGRLTTVNTNLFCTSCEESAVQVVNKHGGREQAGA